MPDLIRRYDNKNQPIITPKTTILSSTYFNLFHLNKGEEHEAMVEGLETLYAVLSGNVEIEVNGTPFKDVGRRRDIWSGKADSVYAGAGTVVRVYANQDGTEVAVAGGVCDKTFPPFRVLPEEIEMVDVGSIETRSHRRIFHLLGQNGNGRANNLLVSELYCDHGCWSGYPPHKHDEDQGAAETAHEEVYHYRLRRATRLSAGRFLAVLHDAEQGHLPARQGISSDGHVARPRGVHLHDPGGEDPARPHPELQGRS
jgi:5-deoxy-glucuronate isomerase